VSRADPRREFDEMETVIIEIDVKYKGYESS
jgi:hypothetical protein